MDNKKQLLQESWLETLGWWSKSLLKYMYGKDVQQVAKLEPGKLGIMQETDDEEGGGRKFIIRGKYKDVRAYSKAIVAEKNYLDTIVEYGEDHMQTVKARTRLNIAVKKFESTTGLKWPFVDEV